MATPPSRRPHRPPSLQQSPTDDRSQTVGVGTSHPQLSLLPSKALRSRQTRRSTRQPDAIRSKKRRQRSRKWQKHWLFELVTPGVHSRNGRRTRRTSLGRAQNSLLSALNGLVSARPIAHDADPLIAASSARAPNKAGGCGLSAVPTTSRVMSWFSASGPDDRAI